MLEKFSCEARDFCCWIQTAGKPVRPHWPSTGQDPAPAVGPKRAATRSGLGQGNSFEFRGTFNHLAGIPDPQRARGAIGASSGNHAHALALACQLLGTHATTVLLEGVPTVKADALVRLERR